MLESKEKRDSVLSDVMGWDGMVVIMVMVSDEGVLLLFGSKMCSGTHARLDKEIRVESKET